MNSSHEFSLQIHIQGGAPSVLHLSGRPMVFGAGEDVDFRLEAPFVSRRHFRLEVIGDRVYITDLGSHNGTYVNGRRLEADERQEWPPGAQVTIADTVRIQLQAPAAPPRPAEADSRQMNLSIEPATLRPGQAGTLTLVYSGQTDEQHVYFRGTSPTPRLEFVLAPREQMIGPGQSVSVRVHVRKLNPFWLGGRFPAQFSAMTHEGLFAKAEAEVRLRPRYELLPLLLLLLVVPVAAATVFVALRLTLPTPPPAVVIQPTFTAAPSATPQPTSTGTLAPSATPTITLTPIPTATACVNQCAALGWPSYIVQPGDTLSSLASAAGISLNLAARANCIANPSIIQVGQAICLPLRPPILSAAASCNRSNFTVTFTLFNSGGPMLGPDTALIRDNGGGNLVGPAGVQLPAGASQGFPFSYLSRPGYNGAAIFSLASGRIVPIASGDCVPPTPTPTPVIPTSTPTPTPNALPDLVVNNISLGGTVTWDTACTVVTVPIQYTIANVGGTGAGTSYSRVAFYQDSGLTQPLGDLCGNGTNCPAVSIPAGGVAVQSQTGTATDFAALYAVAQADVQGYDSAGQTCASATYCNVNESNENNNRSAVLPIPIPACFTGPDIVIGNVVVSADWTLDCPWSPVDVLFSYTVRNIGDQPAGVFNIRVEATTNYVFVNVSGQVAEVTGVTQTTSGTLAPGASQNFNGTLNLAACLGTIGADDWRCINNIGNVVLFAMTADSGGVISESDEGNNNYGQSINLSDLEACIN